MVAMGFYVGKVLPVQLNLQITYQILVDGDAWHWKVFMHVDVASFRANID